MTDEINVILVKRKGRKFLYMRYTCPLTGETFEKSSGATTESEARKQAGKWQAELVAGGGHTRSAKWSDFRSRYEDGKAFGLRPKTVSKVSATFNVIEEVMKPDSLKRITPQWLTLLQKRLLDGGRTPATVESICRHLKAAMNWAREQEIITSVPKFPRLNKVRTAKQMRGRPITAEEFERMLAAVDSVWPNYKHDRNNANQRREQQRESIRFLLRGLWLSGLRLGEALGLTWDQWADGIRVDMSGKFVKLLIPMESEKGGQDRVYPVTPDFAELLQSVPENDRTGKVFRPILYRGVCDRTDTVSRAITAIGEAAKVKVDEKSPRGTKNAPETVWASAHDLRRAFGARWSRKVNSMVLKELMRHSSVTTTEKYYVGINADETAALLAALSSSQVTLEVTHRKNATFQDEETAKTGRK